MPISKVQVDLRGNSPKGNLFKSNGAVCRRLEGMARLSWVSQFSARGLKSSHRRSRTKILVEAPSHSIFHPTRKMTVQVTLKCTACLKWNLTEGTARKFHSTIEAQL